MSICRRMQIDPYLSPCTKLKSKWMKDLHVNPAMMKFTEEKVGGSLESMDTGDHFLSIAPSTDFESKD